MGFKDSKIQDSNIQIFKDSKIQGFKDSRIQRFKDSRIEDFGFDGLEAKAKAKANAKANPSGDFNHFNPGFDGFGETSQLKGRKFDLRDQTFDVSGRILMILVKHRSQKVKNLTSEIKHLMFLVGF